MPVQFAESDIPCNAEGLKLLRSRLLEHPLYHSVQAAEGLRIFMREHVFAVWDFMSLLKRLQQVVTCCEVPWVPPPDPNLARFINEIVLGEESDEDGSGGYCSHFELYLSAMDEIDADTKPIRQFLLCLRRKMSVDQALAEADILPTTRDFVRATLQMTMHGKPHEVASAFFYGREDVIPDMFSRLVESLPRQGISAQRLAHYLHRHIEVDTNDHGPLASKMVKMLCDGNPHFAIEATAAAIDAVNRRISLWDGILAEVQRFNLRT